MDINKTWKKNVWVLVGTMFHIQFKTHNTENYMWEVDNFIFHSITQSFRLEGISSDHLVQPCLGSSRVNYSGLPRTTSSWVTSISTVRDSTSSLGNILVTKHTSILTKFNKIWLLTTFFTTFFFFKFYTFQQRFLSNRSNNYQVLNKYLRCSRKLNFRTMTRNSIQDSPTAIPISLLGDCLYNCYRYDLYRHLYSITDGKLPTL